jgi:primosomal protein N'
MALVKCKECGEEISKKAEKCPRCGSPQKKKTSLFTWIVTIFAVFWGFNYFISDYDISPAEAKARKAETIARKAAAAAKEKRWTMLSLNISGSNPVSVMSW